jgi:hypothetical protein
MAVTMPRQACIAIGRWLAVGLCVSILLSPTGSNAQSSELAQQGGGLIPETAETMRDIPEAPTYRDFLPRRVDLSRYFPIPGHQRNQGSCTAWAVGYAARAYYVSRKESRNIAFESNIPSPAYIYNLSKSSDCDSGTQISSAMDVLKRGALSLSRYPYSPDKCEAPTGAQMAQATDFRIFGYSAVFSSYDSSRFPIERWGSYLGNIKGALSRGDPLILSIKTTDAFKRLKRGEVYQTPTTCSKANSCAHAVTAVGYDDELQAIKIINSWGTGWGTDGFGWIDYRLLKSELIDAFLLHVSKPPADSPYYQPPSCSMTLTPSTAEAGQWVYLGFSSQNATKGVIDNDLGKVEATGYRTVLAERTTTYTATVEGDQGTAACSATLIVRQPTAVPRIVSFKTERDRIERGENVTLSWEVEGVATSVEIDQGIGRVHTRSVGVGPQTSTTYKLTARNAAGTTSATVNVLVTGSSSISLPEDRCGQIETVNEQSGRSIVGYVGKLDDLEWVKANANGAKVKAEVRPWPECEVRMALEKPLARAAAEGLGVRIQRSSSAVMRRGDPLIFDVDSPGRPAHVHVAYLQADGKVVNLTRPGSGATLLPELANSKLRFGTGGDAGRFRVSPPFGREMVLVIASPEPLFGPDTPAIETDRDFLTSLNRAITDKGLAGKISASFDSILTQER